MVLNLLTTFGIIDNGKVIHQFSLKSDIHRTPEEFALLIEQHLKWSNLSKEGLEKAIVASVVPSLTGKMEKMCQDILSIPYLTIAPGIKTGLSLRVENPKELGAEIIALAVGALKDFQPPLIIVNCGTASTFSVINDKREYIGAIIGPGIFTSFNGLLSKASLITDINLLPPKNTLGRNTEEAIRIGFIYGFAGMIDSLIKKIKNDYSLEFKVVATGDWSELIRGITKEIDIIDHNLGLKGLYEIHKLNS